MPERRGWTSTAASRTRLLARAGRWRTGLPATWTSASGPRAEASIARRLSPAVAARMPHPPRGPAWRWRWRWSFTRWPRARHIRARRSARSGRARWRDHSSGAGARPYGGRGRWRAPGVVRSRAAIGRSTHSVPLRPCAAASLRRRSRPARPPLPRPSSASSNDAERPGERRHAHPPDLAPEARAGAPQVRRARPGRFRSPCERPLCDRTASPGWRAGAGGRRAGRRSVR